VTTIRRPPYLWPVIFGIVKPATAPVPEPTRIGSVGHAVSLSSRALLNFASRSSSKSRDCVQIVIALVVTSEGLPLAYEVLPGNTADKTTLRPFLEHIERQYGKARRVWLMDRGVPTEEVLAKRARPTRRCITWWARRRVA
jgi:Transposase DDE domain